MFPFCRSVCFSELFLFISLYTYFMYRYAYIYSILRIFHCTLFIANYHFCLCHPKTSIQKNITNFFSVRRQTTKNETDECIYYFPYNIRLLQQQQFEAAKSLMQKKKTKQNDKNGRNVSRNIPEYHFFVTNITHIYEYEGNINEQLYIYTFYWKLYIVYLLCPVC